MRLSDKATGEVWALLEPWSKSHVFRPNQTRMARLFGVSTSLVSDWKYGTSVMQPPQIAKVADVTGIDAGDLARAVAKDRERTLRAVRQVFRDILGTDGNAESDSDAQESHGSA